MKTDHVEYTDGTGWIDPPNDVQPSLPGDHTCDVAVIGGGIGGMATALRLAERGRDVVLLEAQFCGYGASSRNGGHIAGAPGGDLRLLSLFSGAKVPIMVRLADHAGRFLEDLIASRDIDCDYVANGLVWGAVSPIQMLRVRTMAAILRRAGGHGTVGTSAELGIPAGFVGGMRESVGGMLDPGKLCRGVRRAVLDSTARVYEQTTVTDVRQTGQGVVIETPQGTVRARKAVLATNAYSPEWDITPTNLSVPLWVTEVETEPIAPERLADLEWTSQSGVITAHQIMTNYRISPRNTLISGVRRPQRGTTYPLPARVPDPSVVAELAEELSTRFPTLSDVSIARTWGGWIGITPTWLSVAGRVGDNVYYSPACNGHGLAQAPYVGSLLADFIVDGTMPADLAGIWEADSNYRASMSLLLNPIGLRAVWAVDRLNDLVNGSKTLARRARRGHTPAHVG